MESWKSLIMEEMVRFKESFDDVEFSTLSDRQLHREFDAGFGCSEGARFTLWTKNRVYFPVVYDGAEWVGSVPRNPSHEASRHFGGE